MLKLGFAVVFYRPDENFLATEKISDDVRNIVRSVVLKKPERATIKAIAENPSITAEQLAAVFSKSARTAQRYLDNLQKKNLIRRVGSTKGGHWEIIST
jgi:ATP-dependent DNA helicase RecG